MTASLCLTALAFFVMPAAFLRGFLAAGAPSVVDMGVAAPEGSAEASSNWPSPIVSQMSVGMVLVVKKNRSFQGME